ncbi:gag-pol polyprotein [Tanacetum coccineum]|uniref:Gag-pol polyprotein n=1 Tax=Tanacetum coccineum TaxID=301880 RepID=A0ABQ5BPH9_9ASTR
MMFKLTAPIEEPLVVNHDKPDESNEVLNKDQPQTNNTPVIQTPSEEQTPSIPFPRRLRKEKEEAQQRKFLENLKQLNINLPFIKALAQMPKYAKFLKGLLTNKAILKEACMITVNERCSAILLNKLPSKEKDLGSFTIPCDIGQLHINNALADLGASISLMPYRMYEKLGLGEPKATKMSLELADRSISTETSDGLAAIQAQLNNLRREIKKVNEKVYAAQVGCEQCKGPYYTKDCPLKEEGKTLEEAYYTQFGGPFQGGGYRDSSSGKEDLEAYLALLKPTRGDYVKSISTKLKTDSNPIGRLDHPIRLYPPQQITETNVRANLSHTKLTVELADRTVKYPKGIVENVLLGISKFIFLVNFIILDMPEDVKVPLILRRLFLSTAHAKIDVFKRKITLRVRDEKIIFKSVKPASSLIKRVYMLSLRERMELDLEARLMGETLVLNRSLDPLDRDYIELNDLNVPLELKRDQVDDLMPIIKEDEVIDEPMIDIIKTRNNESFDEYLSFCDFDQKIHIDCACNLRFSCMIVVENMDGYRDQDMRDIILGEQLCKASCVEARRFDGF